MLSLFRKQKNNLVLKLYRTVSFDEARQFNTKYLVTHVLEQLERLFGEPPSDYYITGPYPNKGWKTKNGFLNAIETKNYQDVCHLLISTETYSFSFENWSLNEVYPKKIDNQAIFFSAKEGIVDLMALEKFAINMYRYFPFQYGYLLALPEGYMPSTERKKEKSALTQEDFEWNENIFRIANGLIRNIYPINFIHENLVNKLIFREKIISKGIGNLKRMDIDLYKWTLSEEEIKMARQSLDGSELVFIGKGHLL